MTLLKYALPIFFATSLMGCGQSTTVDTTEKEVKSNESGTEISNLPADAPTYTIALDSEYPPFSFKDENGIVIGYEIDVLRAAGNEAGFKVEALPVQWDGIVDRLEDGSVDIVGGTSVTPERLATHEMSEPHVNDELVFAYLGEPKPYEDIITGVIGAEENTSFIELLRELPEVSDTQITPESTSYMGFADVLTGKTDAVFNDRASLLYQINSIKDMPEDIKVHITSLPENAAFSMAFTMKKGNVELLNQVDEGLKAIKENGKYDEINKKWFNTTA